MLKREFLIPIIYFLVVGIAIPMAFPIDSQLDTWIWCAVQELTLPWSIVGIVFFWAAIYDVATSAFLLYYFVSALVNAHLIYRMMRPKRELV